MLTKITDNIYCLELPMKHSPMGSVNCYIIKGSDRSLLLDAGYNNDEAYKLLSESLEELEIKPEKLDIFLTHVHTDHVGLCERIATPNTTVYVSKQEFWIAQQTSDIKYWLDIEKYFQQNGWPSSDSYSFINANASRLVQMFSFNCKVQYVTEGDILHAAGKTFKVLLTPGHSKGHLSLLDNESKVLFVGDTIIENFYPILYYRENDLDMYGCYLQSIEKIRHANAEVLLSGHKQPIYDIERSCTQAIKHYQKIEKRVMDKLDNESGSAFAITKKICQNNWDDFQLRKKWFYMANVLTSLESIALNKKAFKACHNGKITFSSQAKF